MLIREIRQLVLANANDALDRLEDPEQTAAQMLRDIDGGLRHARMAVIDAVASEKQLANAVNKHGQRVNELERKARLALGSNDEELARSLLE